MMFVGASFHASHEPLLLNVHRNRLLHARGCDRCDSEIRPSWRTIGPRHSGCSFAPSYSTALKGQETRQLVTPLGDVFLARVDGWRPAQAFGFRGNKAINRRGAAFLGPDDRLL